MYDVMCVRLGIGKRTKVDSYRIHFHNFDIFETFCDIFVMLSSEVCHL